MNKFFQQAGLSQRDLEVAVKVLLMHAKRYDEWADAAQSLEEAVAFERASMLARDTITKINSGRLS